MTSPETTPATFADLRLREEVLRAVSEAGYSQPTPIQAAAIPAVLARRDVIGVAQTGTGKTASFVLPMLDILAAGRSRARMPRSLILSPTRELATQTSQNFEIYGKHLNLSMALIIGGVGMGDQEKLLEKGVDVLIATPGRLLDWFERGKVLLGSVQILVIDEADRMLDMGFIPDVERIITTLLGRQQTLLFSATIPPEVRRLADRFLKDPAVVTVARAQMTADAVEDVLVPAPHADKRRSLKRLIDSQDVGKAIVFCNRKREVSSLARWLQREGLNARDIHGDLDQSQRQATLDAFKAGTVDYLIATDVAARGLDISAMPNVVNFDVPMHAEDYVHRIGRTGRAGLKGRAFTLVTGEDRKFLSAIEKLTGKTIPRLEIGGEPPPATGDEAEAPAPRARSARPRREPRAAAAVPTAGEQPVVAPDATPPAAPGPSSTEGRPAPARAVPASVNGRRVPARDGRAITARPVAAAAATGQRARHEPEVEAALRRRSTPRPAERPRRRESEPEPVVFGLSPDLPMFLQRPVPIRALPKDRDD
ncbi:MAG TPA: DEAD/DEAH box helicase [Geminicoccaceae bacterium]|nr:DEAD/DEAH box helicase [Geminicoccaceae bacterium]